VKGRKRFNRRRTFQDQSLPPQAMESSSTNNDQTPPREAFEPRGAVALITDEVEVIADLETEADKGFLAAVDHEGDRQDVEAEN
jgi:hypothetical protein